MFAQVVFQDLGVSCVQLELEHAKSAWDHRLSSLYVQTVTFDIRGLKSPPSECANTAIFVPRGSLQLNCACCAYAEWWLSHLLLMFNHFSFAHASTSSHKYPQPLALGAWVFEISSPILLFGFFVNKPFLCNKSQCLSICLLCIKSIWFNNKANTYLTLKSDKDDTKNNRTASFMNIDTKSSINYSKLNPAAYKKDYTSWPGVIYPRNIRMVQHTHKNNPYNTLTELRAGKAHGHLNWCQRRIWQNPIPLYYMNTQQTRKRREGAIHVIDWDTQIKKLSSQSHKAMQQAGNWWRYNVVGRGEQDRCIEATVETVNLHEKSLYRND